MKVNEEFVEIKAEVKEAIKANKPVVALESTIISHGMPYPQNLEMAKKVEAIVKEEGGFPATIAIMNGKIKIGLTDEELEELAKTPNVAKVSKRDIAYIIATKKIGATTVAATMIFAEMAKIKFFVTGGIGGVHKGYEETLDVSADLEELAQTDVNVICSGAKAILDLPRTWEYLETKGVPIIGYKTKVLPAFYTKESSIPLQIYTETPEEVAQIIYTKDELKLKGSILIVNPIPKEASLDAAWINAIIARAIKQSLKDNISGKEVTPYLLQKIVEKTKGESLKANIALVYNNAKVGTKIAKAYYSLLSLNKDKNVKKN